jgi:hypothetical protein
VADDGVEPVAPGAAVDESLGGQVAAPRPRASGEEPVGDAGQPDLRRRLVLGALREHSSVPFGRDHRVAHRLDAAEFDAALDDRSDVRVAFGLVGVQHIRIPAPQNEIELECDVLGVADPGAHALAEEGWHQMRGIPGQQDPSLSP